MSPNQEHRLEEVFSAARDLPPLERSAFLERACGGDAELRRQADSLLEAHEQAGQFLQPTVALSTPNAPVEKPADRIGHYKLLEQIGEGGFGVVWMAEQEEPVRRRVALKIKPYKSSPEYQLVDEDEPNDILPVQKSGAAWGLIAPTNKVLKSLGEWNQSRMLVLTNHVEHWLNGRKIIEYNLDSEEFRALVAASPFQAYSQFGKARKGGIAFQNWTPGVSFRNIKVRRLVSK